MTDRPAPAKRPKANPVEKLRRTIDTMRLILAGMTTAAIVQTITAQWGIHERQARIYIREARTMIVNEFDALKDGLLAEHILHRRDLRKRAGAAGDLRAELATAADEAKLMGLYAPVQQKVDVTSNGELFTGFDFNRLIGLSAPRPDEDSEVPSAGKSDSHGP